MQWSSVIFDLDGVICHTDQYHYQAWKKLADRLGIYFDEKINNRLRGVSRMESLEIVLEKSNVMYARKEKVRLAEEKNDTYRGLSGGGGRRRGSGCRESRGNGSGRHRRSGALS